MSPLNSHAETLPSQSDGLRNWGLWESLVLNEARGGSPMNCNPQGSSVRGVFQARILEQVAISSSRFYLGGPTSVRGFSMHSVGPQSEGLSFPKIHHIEKKPKLHLHLIFAKLLKLCRQKPVISLSHSLPNCIFCSLHNHLHSSH